MYIEEYIEDDEEPPLLLHSSPSHGNFDYLFVYFSNVTVVVTWFHQKWSVMCKSILALEELSLRGG